MGIWNSIGGTVTVQITGAAIEASLHAFSLRGIVLRNIQHVDDLTVLVTIDRWSLRPLQRMAHLRGDGLSVVGRQGRREPPLINQSGPYVVKRSYELGYFL